MKSITTTSTVRRRLSPQSKVLQFTRRGPSAMRSRGRRVFTFHGSARPKINAAFHRGGESSINASLRTDFSPKTRQTPFSTRSVFEPIRSRRETANYSVVISNKSAIPSQTSATSNVAVVPPPPASLALRSVKSEILAADKIFEAESSIRPEPVPDKLIASSEKLIPPASEDVFKTPREPISKRIWTLPGQASTLPLISIPASEKSLAIESITASLPHISQEYAQLEIKPSDSVERPPSAVSVRSKSRKNRCRLVYLEGSPVRYKKVFYDEVRDKWIKHEVFEVEEDEEPARAITKFKPDKLPSKPHKVKGRQTSNIKSLMPTAIILPSPASQITIRDIELTDELRMELYKRKMPIIPPYFQEHIYKFGKLPFRNNPRSH